MGKYMTVLELFGMSIVSLSITSRSVTVASFVSEIGTSIGLIIIFMTSFLTLVLFD